MSGLDWPPSMPTPTPVAEVLVSALVECITGEALDGAA